MTDTQLSQVLSVTYSKGTGPIEFAVELSA